MSCIGKDCLIVRQEARNPSLTQVQFVIGCNDDQIGRLDQQAKQKILDRANRTIDTCPDGCKCAPIKGAQSQETEWEAVPATPFTLTDGACTYNAISATVETRIVRTPGACKENGIPVSSVAFIGEGIEVAVVEASHLSAARIKALEKVFAG